MGDLLRFPEKKHGLAPEMRAALIQRLTDTTLEIALLEGERDRLQSYLDQDGEPS